MTSPSVQRLAAEIEELRALLMAKRGPQLAYSSLEDGALREYDAEGQLTQIIGKQFDGTHVAAPVAGPPPPIPSAPEVFRVIGGLKVRWDGTFMFGAVAPMDWARLEIHVSPVEDFDAKTFDTLAGEITSPRGGEVTIAISEARDFWVRLVARSLSGKASLASGVVGPVRPGLIGQSDLDFSLDDIGGTKIHYGDEDPTVTDPDLVPAIGDVWFKEVAPGPPPQYETMRWDGAGWTQVQDQGIGQALADALLAQQIAESKARITDSTVAPANPQLGDYWRNPAEGNRMYRWSASGVLTRTNRVWNPRAVVDAFGWMNSQNASNVRKHPSSPQLRWEATANGASRVRTNSLNGGTAPMPVKAGEVLRFYARVTSVSRLQRVQLMIHATNAAGGVIESIVGHEITTTGSLGSFHTVNKVYTVPAGVEFVSLMIQWPDALAGETFVATNVMVAEVGDYFDGDSGGEAVWLGTPNASQSRTWEVAEGAEVGWKPVLLRTGAIEPKSIVARDIIATGTVSAALLEAMLILTTTVIAGDPNGSHSRMTPSGFYIYSIDSEGGVREAGRFGTAGNDFISVAGPGDSTLASISSEGNISGQAANFESLSVGGEEVMGLFNPLPKGICGFGRNMPTRSVTNGEIGIAELDFDAEMGRTYRITVTPMLVAIGSGTAVGTAQLRLRGNFPTVNGGTAAAPTVTSPVLGDPVYVRSNYGGYHSLQMTYVVRCWNAAGPEEILRNGRVRLLLTIGADAANVQIYSSSWKMSVEDIGPAWPNTVLSNTGGGGSTDPGQTLQRVTRTWTADWTTTLKGDLSERTDTTDAVQGYHSSNGNQRSMIGFPTFFGAVGAESIIKAELYLYANQWYFDSGGTAVIGYHDRDAKSSSWYSNLQFNSTNWPKPGGRWVTLPSSWHPFIISGTLKGVTLGPGPSTSSLYYGRFNGSGASSRKPQMRITYERY